MGNDYALAQSIRTEGRLWVMQQRFWLFGTAVYKDGSQIDTDTATRNARRFFNALDRFVLTRKEVDSGIRLPRLVFLETGRQRANTHIHFYIKGTHWTHYRTLYRHADRLWQRHIEGSNDLRITDNIEPNTDRAGYCWKEVRQHATDVLLVDCCHL